MEEVEYSCTVGRGGNSCHIKTNKLTTLQYWKRNRTWRLDGGQEYEPAVRPPDQQLLPDSLFCSSPPLDYPWGSNCRFKRHGQQGNTIPRLQNPGWPEHLFSGAKMQQSTVQVSLGVEQNCLSSLLAFSPHFAFLPSPSVFPFFNRPFLFFVCSLNSSQILFLFHPDRYWFESCSAGILSPALTMTLVKRWGTTTSHGWLQGRLWSLSDYSVTLALFIQPSSAGQLHFGISFSQTFWLYAFMLPKYRRRVHVK